MVFPGKENVASGNRTNRKSSWSTRHRHLPLMAFFFHKASWPSQTSSHLKDPLITHMSYKEQLTFKPQPSPGDKCLHLDNTPRISSTLSPVVNRSTRFIKKR